MHSPWRPSCPYRNFVPGGEKTVECLPNVDRGRREKVRAGSGSAMREGQGVH
jgi:hypothetical protein